MYKTRKLICLLLVVLFASLFADCQHRSGGLTGISTNDSINWEDSARNILMAVEALYNNDQHDSLLKVAPEAMDILREHKQWDIYYIIWQHVVDDHIWYNEFPEATREGEAMQKDAVERKDTFGLALSYISQGTGFYVQKNFNEARRCFSKAVSLYPKNARKGALMGAYEHYAETMIYQKDYAALDTLLATWRDFLNGLPEYTDSASKRGVAHWHFQYYSHLFNYLIQIDSIQQAVEALDSIVWYAQKKGMNKTNTYYIAERRFKLAMAKGDYAEALRYSDEEAELAEEDVSYQLCVLKNRSEALEKLGRYQEALEAHQAYMELNDSVTQAVNREQLNHLSRRYQVNELQSQNKLLRQRSRFTTGGVAMILGIVALLAFLAVNGRWTRRMGIKNQQLQRERNVVVAQNKQLALERDRAEAASKAKTAFIRSMTHEIRTPLNAISGFSQIMAMTENELTSEERIDISQRIMDGTRMLTNILDDLILISDYESRTEPLPIEDCLIASIADQAVDAVRPLVAEGVTIESKLSIAQELILKTNSLAIQNVLARLLTNAAKFTTEGHITLTTTFEGLKLHFAVSDSGPGIPEDKREYIFERFAKLDSFSQGAGLGLTVARLLAEHLGGTLTLDANYSGGAKFDFIIPVA